MFVCEVLFKSTTEVMKADKFYFFWLQIEFQVFVVTILASVIFLAVRFFIEDKNVMSLSVSQTNATTDYAESNNKVLAYAAHFTNIWLVSGFGHKQYFGENNIFTPVAEDSKDFNALQLLRICGMISVICYYLQTFISMTKAPKWAGSWFLKLSPPLVGLSAATAFFFVPLTIVFYFLFNMSLTDAQYGGWIFAVTISTIFPLVDFVTFILPMAQGFIAY